MPQITDNSSPRLAKAFRNYPLDYPVAAGRTYTAAGVYDKVGILVVLALVTGTYSYFANSPALIWVGLLGGLGFSLAGIFKPNLAKYMAPAYALAEGLALGGITRFYATGDTGIIPAAVFFTGAIFVACLVVFRSGLVKVTPKFASMAVIGAAGFMVVIVAGFLGLYSISSPGADLVIGAIGVLLGIAFLFVDFQWIQNAEQAQLPADAEWLGALLLMTSLVLVYINVLRILGRGRR